MIKNSFSKLPLNEAVLANLATLGYHEMTPIQDESLPLILEGKDVIAQAQTGSGKTAAFSLGLLNKIQPHKLEIQGLVLCPTRELAEQVAQEIRRLARCIPNVKVLTLCGGVPTRPQIESLKFGAHIVVGTPGRILDLLYRETVDFRKVKTLVLDEADRMLAMGFAEDIDKLLRQIPRDRQTLLFSATYPESIGHMSAAYQKKPVNVKLQSLPSARNIEQLFFKVEDQNKPKLLEELLGHYAPQSTLVFCNTKDRCKEISALLYKSGINALALHGDLEQHERNQILARFASKTASVLVATDVAARGLDFDELAAVIILDLSADPEVHIHRMGRTGRAGKSGLAISLCSELDRKKMNAIEEQLGKKINLIVHQKLVAAKQRIIAPMVCIQINGGKRDKLRPGDILGGLTSAGGIKAALIDKINIFENHSLVAVQNSLGSAVVEHISRSNIKGRRFKAKLIN